MDICYSDYYNDTIKSRYNSLVKANIVQNKWKKNQCCNIQHKLQDTKLLERSSEKANDMRFDAFKRNR
jgi:hypothetical protein